MKYKFYPTHSGEEIPSCKEVYSSKEEVRKHLASFHSADWTGEKPIESLTLDELLEHGQWELREIAFTCPLCYEGHVEYKEWLSTHIYSCEACPFLAFEFNTHKDLEKLTDYLNHH